MCDCIFTVGMNMKTHAFLSELLLSCTRISICLCACALSQSASAQSGGLVGWWVGSDYTNTDKTVGVSWTDRVSGLSANAVAGNSVYPYLNAAGTGVTFERSGSSYASAGANFSCTVNPVKGLSDFTVLVTFTPSAVGCTGNGAFYQDSGLVGAEQGGVTNDWGLGYKSNKSLVAGYGVQNGSDTTLSGGSVEVGAKTVAGMTVNGSQLNVWQNGVSKNQASVTNKPRNDTPLLIGRMGADGGWYAGDISEIKIFNHALGASEMSIQYDMMTSTSPTYSRTGNGTWEDANWKKSDGTTGVLEAGTNAFLEGGTVTMGTSTVVKTVTVGNGLSTGTAVLNATTASLAGAGKVVLIEGGKLNYSNTIATNNIYLDGGTYTGVTAIAGTNAEFHLEGGTFVTGGSFNVGGYDGTGAGKFIMTGGTLNIAAADNYFCVGNRSTGAAVMSQSGGTANLGWLTVGHKTTGTYNLSGGNLNIARMTLGEGTDGATTGNGTFNMTGGTLKATDNISVGTASTGAFNLGGGTLIAPTFTVTGNGSFTVTGGNPTQITTLNSAGQMKLKGGTLAATTVNLTGGKLEYTAGTLNVADLNVNAGAVLETKDQLTYGTASTVQRITMNGGTYTTTGAETHPHRATNIGNSGIGEFVLNSGSVTMGGDTNFGNDAAGTGTLKINGGNMYSNSLNIGRNGTGFMTVTNGTLTSGYYLSIADSAGSNGTVTVSGGCVKTNVLSVGNRSEGALTQTGGVIYAKNTNVGESLTAASGDLKVSGGILKTEQTLHVGKTGTGKMTISGDAYVQAKTVQNAQNITFEGGNLITTQVNGNLTQSGGTLHVGGNISEGLDWSRIKFTGVADGFPGYTQPNTTGHFKATTEQYNAFWDRMKNSVPQATGTGKFGDGQFTNTQDEPYNYYSLIYDGMLYINSNDTYTFSFSADDGGFLYIDGQQVSHMSAMDRADPWGQPSINTPVTLAAGWHDIEFRYYEGWGGNSIGNILMTNATGNTVNLSSSTNQGMILANFDPQISDLHIAGNYTLGEDAVLKINANADTNEYDRLFVSGTADLNGELVVDVLGNSIYVGDMKLLNTENGGTLNMNFDKITINSAFDPEFWDISGLMAGGNGILSLRHDMVPEPSAWILFLVGVGLLFRAGKRRA